MVKKQIKKTYPRRDKGEPLGKKDIGHGEEKGYSDFFGTSEQLMATGKRKGKVKAESSFGT